MDADFADSESHGRSNGAMSFLHILGPTNRSWRTRIDLLKHRLNGHVLVAPLEFSIDFNGTPKTRNGQISNSTNDLDLILDAIDAESEGLLYGAMSFLVILGPKNRFSKT